MKSIGKFIIAVTTIALGLVIGLFVFSTINETVAISQAPATAATNTPTPSSRQTLSNGSTIQYYDNGRGRTTTAAEAFATMDARATATAIARAQP